MANLIHAKQPEDKSDLEKEIIAKALSQIGVQKAPQERPEALLGRQTIRFSDTLKEFLARRETGNPMNKPRQAPATVESSNRLEAEVFAYRYETVKMFKNSYATQCTAIALEFSKYGIKVAMSGEYNLCMTVDHPNQIQSLADEFRKAAIQIRK